jgi:hypothetical protein
MFDNNDFLWGTVWNPSTEYFKIIRQTNKGWEIIDSSNSNLSTHFSNPPQLLQDITGNLWINLENAAGRTTDGYSWTYYDSSSGLPRTPIRSMFIDYRGLLTILYKINCTTQANGFSDFDDTCSSVLRMSFVNNTWHSDTIKAPVPLTVFSECFEDSRGELWITNFEYQWRDYLLSSSMCRHSAISGWIHYDSANTSFTLERYLGEDARGRLYFSDIYSQTVVFDPEGLSQGNKLKSRKVHVEKGFRCIAENGFITVHLPATSNKNIEIHLLTVQGRSVSCLYSGSGNTKGTTMRFHSRYASGVYLMRLSTAGGAQVKQVLLR